MISQKLLIIEDDVALQNLLALALRRHHIAFDVVTSAEDALMMLADIDYSGLIVDLALPQMDGWTFLETLRRNPRTATIPCIAITCYHISELDAVALDVGFTAYFRKPLDIEVFVKRLPAILAMNQSCRA